MARIIHVKPVLNNSELEPENIFEIIETDETYRYDICKKRMGQDVYLNFVPLNREDTMYMCVDDDGLFKEPFSFYFENKFLPLQKLYGDIIFTAVKPLPAKGEVYDYELRDFTEDELIELRTLVSSSVQKELAKKFMKQYGRPNRVRMNIDMPIDNPLLIAGAVSKLTEEITKTYVKLYEKDQSEKNIAQLKQVILEMAANM